MLAPLVQTPEVLLRPPHRNYPVVAVTGPGQCLALDKHLAETLRLLQHIPQHTNMMKRAIPINVLCSTLSDPCFLLSKSNIFYQR